ncbi:sensor histidine kinase [Rhodovibrio salinarum]|uniref:sensor histidine kinase n=1 Tax=Rhodovibrio salinarum TaxID=1087 RepID=UPI001902E26C|nr:sensor histidine kinase [Rhodovibrio salinarum]
MGVRPGSLSFRLLLGAMLWIALALVVTGVVLTRIFAAHIEDQFAQRQEALLNQLAANLEVGPQDSLTLTGSLSPPQFERPYSGTYWQVQASDGEVLLRSRSLWDAALPLPSDTLLNGQVHRHRLTGPGEAALIAYERAVRLPGRDDQLRLVVARDAVVLDTAVQRFARVLTVSLSVLGLGLIAAAGAQIAGGLRPLGRLRRALGEVRAGRAQRLEGTYPAEIQPLVTDLNAVLQRNATVVEQARTQAGNLAHGLKTPLSVLSNEAAVLENTGQAAFAARIAEQTRIMQRQIDYHLARARVAATVDVPGSRADAQAALQRLARTMSKLYAAKQLSVEADGHTVPAFRGDRQDLEEMLGNLVDNACKWAHAQVRLSARPAATEGWLVIAVDDDGPGLPEDQRMAVFDRGRRLDTRVDGSGLGLAIVVELAELYGGTVALGDSDLGGLCATLTLPAAGDA